MKKIIKKEKGHQHGRSFFDAKLGCVVCQECGQPVNKFNFTGKKNNNTDSIKPDKEEQPKI
jgi:hypothetical protein